MQCTLIAFLMIKCQNVKKANFVCFNVYVANPFTLFFYFALLFFYAYQLFIEHSEILAFKGCDVIKEQ